MAKHKGEFWKVTYSNGESETFFLTGCDKSFGWGGVAVRRDEKGDLTYDNFVRFPFGIGIEEVCLVGIYECLECGQTEVHNPNDYMCEKCRKALP